MVDKVKILFAEDEVDVRASIAAVLESEGYEVLQAENGKEALEIFNEKEPEIVISDIMMPEMNGYDLLKTVRESQDNSRNNVPFILLSALGQKEDIIKGVTLEASDYLVKPIDFDLLIVKINEKTASFKRNQQLIEGNIENLKTQVSSMLPNEMLQYVDMISKISEALKGEIYGPLPHQKYIEDLNKIYINSLKLKTMVNNLFNGSSLSNHLLVSDEVISPDAVLQSFIGGLNKKYQDQIVFEERSDDNLPNIKIDKKIFNEVLKKLIGCVFKIDDSAIIRVVIMFDHIGRVIFIFYPEGKIDKVLLENHLKRSVIDNSLDSQGLNLEVVNSNQVMGVILSIPDFRVIKK